MRAESLGSLIRTRQLIMHAHLSNIRLRVARIPALKLAPIIPEMLRTDLPVLLLLLLLLCGCGYRRCAQYHHCCHYYCQSCYERFKAALL